MSLLLLLRQRSGSVAYTLACAPGAYALQGKAAVLAYTPGSAKVDYSLPCATGSYVLTGKTSTLAKGVGLQCQTGVYSLIGRTAVLSYVPGSAKVDYSLVCGPGVYTLQGNLATLVVKRTSDGKSGYWRDYLYRLQAEALATKLSKDRPKVTDAVSSTPAIRVVYSKPLTAPKVIVQTESAPVKPTQLATALQYSSPTASFDYAVFFAGLHALQAIPIACEVAVSAANIYDDEEESAAILLLAA